LSLAQPCPHGQIDELLCECVIVDPGSTVYIGALLHHLRRSDRPRRTEVITVWRRIFLSGKRNEFRSTLRQAAETQNWDQVLTLAPPALCQQPQSIEILQHLATACAALEHEQAELCYLQAAAALAPADAETQRQLARALTRQGLFDDAAIAWKRLAELLPEDEECRQTIKILCEHQPLEGFIGLLSESEVGEIANALNTGTVTVQQVRKLFDHLRGWRKFDQAELLLDHAAVLLGPSLSLLEWREQLAIDRSDHPMFVATALGDLRAEYRQSDHRATSQSVRTHLQVQYQRYERHPNDLAIQLHLGQLLTFSGNYSEAIKRLEEVVKIPQYRARALQSLGYAWEKLKQSDKAMSCYEESLEIALREGDEETASWSLQIAADLAERTGNIGLARDFCTKMMSLSCPNEGRRLQQDFARTMLDNLKGVCHNS
ncbi:MAG TPA: hypothetical protein VMP01_01945, partial [Pirellulaceae bacterium]|nr:hypothetical protein [Pirellulaceae bacterium]